MCGCRRFARLAMLSDGFFLSTAHGGHLVRTNVIQPSKDKPGQLSTKITEKAPSLQLRQLPNMPLVIVGQHRAGALMQSQHKHEI